MRLTELVQYDASGVELKRDNRKLGDMKSKSKNE